MIYCTNKNLDWDLKPHFLTQSPIHILGNPILFELTLNLMLLFCVMFSILDRAVYRSHTQCSKPLFPNIFWKLNFLNLITGNISTCTVYLLHFPAIFFLICFSPKLHKKPLIFPQAPLPIGSVTDLLESIRYLQRYPCQFHGTCIVSITIDEMNKVMKFYTNVKIISFLSRQSVQGCWRKPECHSLPAKWTETLSHTTCWICFKRDSNLNWCCGKS